MTRRRSRRRQEQLNRELFGPGPRTPRMPKRRKPRAPVEPPTVTPGSCWACGNVCSPAVEWTCCCCGVVYPPVEHANEAWVVVPDEHGGYALTMETSL